MNVCVLCFPQLQVSSVCGAPVLPVLLPLLDGALSAVGEEQWPAREAACLAGTPAPTHGDVFRLALKLCAVGVVAEGCMSIMVEHMHALHPRLVQLSLDAAVSAAACLVDVGRRGSCGRLVGRCAG